jgi:hypothetical protein
LSPLSCKELFLKLVVRPAGILPSYFFVLKHIIQERKKKAGFVISLLTFPFDRGDVFIVPKQLKQNGQTTGWLLFGWNLVVVFCGVDSNFILFDSFSPLFSWRDQIAETLNSLS